MMKAMKKVLLGALCAALALGAAGCASTSRLDPYELWGSRLAARMLPPPEPRLQVNYDVSWDSQRPVHTALSVLTNLAKASQAEKADAAMREALDRVDVPGIVADQALSSCAQAIGATRVALEDRADYVLQMDIRSWGIHADSWGSAVTLHMDVRAGLYRSLDGENLWSRSLTVDQPASPSMFGLGDIVGSMVTATTLSEMSPEKLADGFTEMARSAAREMTRLLQRDIDRARYNG